MTYRLLFLLLLAPPSVLAQADRVRVIQVGDRLPSGTVVETVPDCSQSDLSHSDDGTTFSGRSIAVIDEQGSPYCVRHRGAFYRDTGEIFSGFWVDGTNPEYQTPGIGVRGWYSWPSGQLCEGVFNIAETLPPERPAGFESGTCTFSDGGVFEGRYYMEGSERFADGLLSRPSGSGQRGRFRLAETPDGFIYEPLAVEPAQRVVPEGSPRNPVVISRLATINAHLVRYRAVTGARLTVDEETKQLRLSEGGRLITAPLAELRMNAYGVAQLYVSCFNTDVGDPSCIQQNGRRYAERSYPLMLFNPVAPSPDGPAIVTAFEELRTELTGLASGQAPAPPAPTPRPRPGGPSVLSLGETANGRLDDSDHRLEAGEFVDRFTVQVDPGRSLVLDLFSNNVDPYLLATSPSGRVYENDDWNESVLHARIALDKPEPGIWTVEVTSYEAGEVGNYELRTQSTYSVTPPRSPWHLDATDSRRGLLHVDDLRLTSGEAYDDYFVQVAPGRGLVVDLFSIEFDPYLIVIAPSGESFENDDWDGSTIRSRIEIPRAEPGEWIITVSSYEIEYGNYTVEVESPRASGR